MIAPDARHVRPDVQVVVATDDGRTVARVRGRVDYTTVGVVRERLLEAAAAAPGVLVVDLTAAELADPTGPAALLHLYDVCRAQSIRFVLELADGSSAATTLHDCGLLGLLPCHQ